MTTQPSSINYSQLPTPKVSYSEMAQQVQVPTKEHAVVFDAIDGISIQDYARAIAKKISPASMKFISRISHGRVCVYFSSKEIADHFTENKTKINIGSHDLEARPLISKAKRIILSNACPIIPHEVILNELSKHNITPVSKISYIRAGMTDHGFTHLLSFRRQMYIKPEDQVNLPPVLPIIFDDTTYHIYLSTEKLICFNCNEEGHLAKHCSNPASQLDTSAEAQNEVISDVLQGKRAPALPISLSTTSNSKLMVKDKDMPPPSNKRLPPKSLSASSTSTSKSSVESLMKEENTEAVKTGKAKKAKLSTATNVTIEDIHTQLEPAKEFIVEDSSFPLTYSQVSDFLLKTHGQQNILDIAKDYTSETNSLVAMLNSINERISSNNLKHRITRLKMKLQQHDQDDIPSRENSASDLDA